MSVNSFLLLLLCISLHLHTCKARRFSNLDKKLEKKTYFSTKNDKGLDSSSEQLELRNNGDKSMETPPAANAEKTKNTSFKQIRVLKVKEKASSSSRASSKSESLVSVSWRVPRKKPGEKNPGFNLDYSPPKTHPPSHN